MIAPRQFALPFTLAPHYDAADFLTAPCNAEAMAWIGQPAAWPNQRLAVFGETGTGKTHLLHVYAARSGAQLLDAAGLRGFAPLPDAPALAIDDADCAPDPRGLLHVLNAAAEAKLPVLLAASTAPAHWQYGLPDLVSRLRAITAVRLDPPDDTMLHALLARLFAERQLAVPAPVQTYLLTRLPRTGGALREAVARLDRAALAAGRRISIAMADTMLADMAAAGGDP